MLTLRDYAEGAWRFIAVCEGCGRESRVEPGEVLSGSARTHLREARPALARESVAPTAPGKP